MANHPSGGNEPGKGFNRALFLIVAGALVVILAAYYFLAFSREPMGNMGTPTKAAVRPTSLQSRRLAQPV